MGAFGGAIGGNGIIDMAALGAAAAGLGRGASSMRSAVTEFQAAARWAHREAAELDMAAEAYARAGAAEAAQAQRRRAGRSRKRGSMADRWASNAGTKAAILMQAEAMWDNKIAEWQEDDERGGDRAKWADSHSRLYADIDYDRSKWAGLARAADKAAAVAGDRLERAEGAAKTAAADAELGPDDPGTQEAKAALRIAMVAARQATGGF